MKIRLKDQIESAHQWIDEDGKRGHTVITGKAGDELDSETAEYGDAERALRKLVRLGLADEV